MKCKGRKKIFNTKNADNGNNSNLTLAKFETKVVRNIFNYLNKNTFLKDLLRNGLQFL